MSGEYSPDMKSLLEQMVQAIDKDQWKELRGKAGIKGEELCKLTFHLSDVHVDSLCIDESGTPVACP